MDRNRDHEHMHHDGTTTVRTASSLRLTQAVAGAKAKRAKPAPRRAKPAPRRKARPKAAPRRPAGRRQKSSKAARSRRLTK